jgi:hypothetical protein
MCPRCEARGHSPDSRFCRICGYELRMSNSGESWGTVPPEEVSREA